MAFLTIIILAFALAMDAFAVSIICGAAYRRLRPRGAFQIALFFGAFQAVMPLVGALGGLGLKGYIAHYDHWLAFGLLAAIGSKMIYESFKIKSIEDKPDPTNISVLLLLSVATSIDALAVGITLPFIKVPIAAAVVIIGIVTFLLSYFGVFLGKRIGHFFENKIQLAGGLVLIALGCKILLGHLL